MVGKAQKSQEARSKLNSVFCLGKVDQWNPIRTSAIQSRSRPHAIPGLFQPRELQGKKFRSDREVRSEK
jgi:hypothetical protein